MAVALLLGTHGETCTFYSVFIAYCGQYCMANPANGTYVDQTAVAPMAGGSLALLIVLDLSHKINSPVGR